MFVGHYGVSFAAKRGDRSIPLWTLFLAVQLLDVFWSVFVVAGLEKVRIAPGITASNPFDLRSEEHTSELQSQSNLVCRLLLEKKKTRTRPTSYQRWRIPQS